MTETKTPKRRGPKPKLTKELQGVIVARLSNGNKIGSTCEYAGISTSTYNVWIEKGEEGQRPYDEFARLVKKARAFAEIEALEEIRAAGRGQEGPDGKRTGGSWQASAWFLEHSFPDKWGRRTAVEMSGPDGAPLPSAQQPSIRVVIATDKGEIISDNATFPPEDDQE